VNTLMKRILVIEDNTVYCRILRLWLESNGYQTLICHDGLDGLNTAKKEKPDLIILDLLLPSLDGHKVCRLLKADQSFSTIPIVIYTSRDLNADEILAKQCGADAFVVKTVQSGVILNTIRGLLTATRDNAQ
jgi:DNA-binding response OmpR family regulator